MVLSLNLLLLLMAFICFVLAAFGVGSRVNLSALGLAFMTAAMIVR